MDPEVCLACNNFIPSENSNTEEDFELSSFCISKKNLKKISKRHARTSTPIQELENSPPTDSPDSVNEFFYQSWKNGLHCSEPVPNQEQQCVPLAQPFLTQPPVCNVTQVIFVNTVFVQPVIPQMVIMPDGTLGILPTYLPCNVNFV